MNLNVIRNPKIEDRNTIVGELKPGVPVKVSRRVHHFNVNLVVSIDGVVVHDSEFDKDEIQQWLALERHASQLEFVGSQSKKRAVCDVAKEVGLFGLPN
jgi:hypothetical protein